MPFTVRERGPSRQNPVTCLNFDYQILLHIPLADFRDRPTSSALCNEKSVPNDASKKEEIDGGACLAINTTKELHEKG